MDRIDEERGLFDELVRRLERRGLRPLFVGAEEVLRDLPAGERIEEDLRVEEVLPELGDDFVRVRADVQVLLARERSRGAEHRGEGALRRRTMRFLVEEDLRLEELALRAGQLDFDVRNDLAGALA